MAKYCLKKPSKRLTCKKKFKIQRKVKEHSKKLKKLAKESAKKKKGDKPISVPNKCPFKEELLLQAEKKRQEIKEEQVQKKSQQKLAKKENKKRKITNVGDSMEKLAKRAAIEEEKFTENQYLLEALPEKIVDDTATKTNAKTVKTYANEMRRTIEGADIILEVLDARDPLGGRSTQIEQLVIDSGKRLVLLLNKIDLVPKENLLKWLAYLRQQFPTIAFKASTQAQNQKLGRFSYSSLMNPQLSAKCIGAELVMKLLANYCRNKQIKTSIRVGVVGFPNVGKSSVINSLKRKRACQTGATPGLTKQMQEIELDKHIRLIDSPGVVLPPKGQQLDASELSLRNVIRVETLADPITPIQAILRRCSVKVLMLHYGIPEFADCDQFLALLSRRLGRLQKGGRPNLNAAAKQVLNDWNSGKLRYYTEPPTEEEKMDEGEGNNPKLFSAQLVAEFAKEFDLDALDQDIRVIIDEMPEDHMVVETPYDPTLPIQTEHDGGDNDHDGEEEEERMEMDHQGDERIVVLGNDGKRRKKKKNKKDKNDGNMEKTAESNVLNACMNEFLPPPIPTSLAIGDGNVQLGKAMKKAVKNAVKKRKKHQIKMANKAENLAEKLLTRMDLE